MGYPFAIEPRPTERRPRFDSIPGYFSLHECQQIVAAASRLPAGDATVSSAHVNDERIRKSTLRWAFWDTPGFDWVFQKLVTGAMELNERSFRFDLSLLYSLQFTEYHAPANHYTYHQDLGDGPMSTRKLSVTVQLSQPEEYEGGEFELFSNSAPLPKFVGSLVAFPSYEMHRVMPVTKGIRRSIVAWICGAPFR